jgi:hypothetical protein
LAGVDIHRVPRIVVDGRNDFSFGGWFRVEGTQFTYEGSAVLMQSLQPTVSLGISGSAPFAHIANTTVTDIECMEDDLWHYLLVTFQASEGVPGSGTVCLWVDGVYAGGATIQISSSTSVTDWRIGVTAADGFSRTATVWSRCLQPPNYPEHQPGEVGPDWSVPGPGPGVVMAADLTVNPPVDRSGGGGWIDWACYSPATLTPSLSLGNSQYAVPSVTGSVNPRAASPFSVAAWVRPEVPLSNIDPSVASILANGTIAADTSFLLGLQVTSAASYIPFACLGEFQNAVTGLDNAAVPPGQWSYIAATFDGQAMSVYLNGTLVGTTTAHGNGSVGGAALMIGAAPDVSGSVDLELDGRIQAMAIWTCCLTNAEVAASMTNVDTDNDDCVAYWPFATPAVVDSVSGLPVDLSPGATIDELVIGIASPGPWRGSMENGQDITEQEPIELAGPASAYSKSGIDESGLASWPSPLDLLAFGGLGEDESAPTETAAFTSADRHRVLTEYEEMLQRFVPEDLRPKYLELFTTNLDLGIRLAASHSGPLPGMVAHRFDDDGELVFTVHTVNGPVDLIRITGAQALSPCTIFWLEVAASCLGLVLTLFGVGFTVAAIRKFFIASVSGAINGVAVAAEGFAAVEVTGMSVLAVVKAINVGGLLSGALWVAITAGGSWWGLGWTIFCITGQILAIYVSGGAMLLYYAAGLAFSIAALANTVSNRPKGCNPQPSLYGMFPNTVTAGTEGVSLRLVGQRIMTNATAQWNGANRGTTIVSTTEATTQLTSDDVRTAGVGTVTLSNPSSSGPSTGLTFTVTPAAEASPNTEQE